MRPLHIQTPEIEARCSGLTNVPLVEFDVPVPAHLDAYGATTRASLLGEGDAPLVIVLGGISGNRFPCLRPDGNPVDPGRFASDFAAGVNELLADPERAAEMGRAGRRRAVEKFSWGGIAEQTIELYRSLS